ncbi:phage terminase small subunit [Aliivibrio fischeri]|uniref:phage terminase small subunit n=1 Tax=Aliivibrio fischeri TaxID=668 RepID=UPI00084CC64E|nr:phage terminase small subunit [Aliivibrio fischeri]MUJ27986.1 hypothetical protein [Aliivibrio fischeri]OED52804.1 hypothetical protein BEI47_18945 [Aliivibrio fischeri]
MLTLLNKQKALVEAKTAIKTRTIFVTTSLLKSKSENINEKRIQPLNSSFVNKSWDEIQHELKVDLKYDQTLTRLQEKMAFKLCMIKKYTPIVEHLLNTHDNFERLDIIWWYFQWQIDCGALTDIHDTFKYCVLNGLNSPKGWSFDGQTAYLNIIFKCSDIAYKAGIPFNMHYLIEAVCDISNGILKTNPQLKVKLFRLAGDVLFDAGKNEEARSLFNNY